MYMYVGVVVGRILNAMSQFSEIRDIGLFIPFIT